MSRHRKRRHRIRWHSIYLWHRYMGLAAALFVVLLAVTGWMLNHTHGLGLDQRHIKSTTLLDWYGIEAPDDAVSYRADDHWVTQMGRRIYFDERPLDKAAGELIGAQKLGQIIVVAVTGHLLLLTPDGDVIERLGGAHGVPAGMRQLGRTAGERLVVEGAHGMYTTDSDLLRWREGAVEGVQWQQPGTPPPSLYSRLVEQYRGTGLSLERVILDLHSGRVLGQWGVYLMDGVAVLFVLLAAAGIWLWARRTR